MKIVYERDEMKRVLNNDVYPVLASNVDSKVGSRVRVKKKDIHGDATFK